MFDKYPYSNFHEMNLDWIIKEMEELVDEWSEYGASATASAHSSASPSVTVTGDLKTGLNFDFGLVKGDTGPQGETGATGPQGPAGSGLEILDEYATLNDLIAAHPTGLPGDMYLVGSGGTYILYLWSTEENDWVEGGSLTSPSPAVTNPSMDGTASPGISLLYARADHVHPKDTSKQNIVTDATLNDIAVLNGSGQVVDGGKKISDLQDLLTAGAGIDITNSIISNRFSNLSNTSLNSVKYNAVVWCGDSCSNMPTTYGGLLISCFSSDEGAQGCQIFEPYYENGLYFRRYHSNTWESWVDVTPKFVKVWENSAPSSTFAAQSITDLDLTPYSMLFIQFKYSSSGNYITVPANIHGYSERATVALNTSTIYSRVFTPHSTYIQFNGGFVNGSTANDDVMIPFRIYGAY